MNLYLASASPRRADILAGAGLSFRAVPANTDESPLPSECPEAYALRMALAKAEKVFAEVSPLDPEAAVLGADTIVVKGPGLVLGKPDSRGRAREMLSELSGGSHRVLTGFAVKTRASLKTGLASTLVSFRALSDWELDAYSQEEETLDKAGAYAIQGRFGPLLVDRVEGSYSNIVGLPLKEVLEALSAVSFWGPGLR